MSNEMKDAKTDQPRIIGYMSVRAVANGIEVVCGLAGSRGYPAEDKDVFVFESVDNFIAWCASLEWDFKEKPKL